MLNFTHKLYLLISLIFRVEEMKDWIKIQATIMDSRFINRPSELKSFFSRGKSLFVYFRYSYKNHNFGSTTVNRHPHTTKYAQRIASKLSVSDKVDVYINPLKPHESCLLSMDSHTFMYDYFRVSLSLIFLILSICLLVINHA